MLHELVEEIVRHRVFAVFARVVVVVRHVVRTIVVEDDQLLVGVALENVGLHLNFYEEYKMSRGFRANTRRGVQKLYLLQQSKHGNIVVSFLVIYTTREFMNSRVFSSSSFIYIYILYLTFSASVDSANQNPIIIANEASVYS